MGGMVGGELAVWMPESTLRWLFAAVMAGQGVRYTWVSRPAALASVKPVSFAAAIVATISSVSGAVLTALEKVAPKES